MMDTKQLKRKSKQGAFISFFGFLLIVVGFGLASNKLISLNKEIVIKSDNLTKIKKSIEVGTLTNDELIQHNSQLNIQNTDLKHQLTLKSENINLLSSNIGTLKNHVIGLNEDLESKQLLITNLNEKIIKSTNSLQDLKNQAALTQDQLKTKREAIKKMNKEISSLGFQLNELKSEKIALNGFLDKYSDNVNSQIVPKASSVKDGNYYNFKIWLDISESQLRKISSVSYFFNHSSFKYPKVVVKNSDDGFKTGYKGWGCLANMPIIITFNNGKEETLIFKMCEYLDDPSIRVK